MPLKIERFLVKFGKVVTRSLERYPELVHAIEAIFRNMLPRYLLLPPPPSLSQNDVLKKWNGFLIMSLPIASRYAMIYEVLSVQVTITR